MRVCAALNSDLDRKFVDPDRFCVHIVMHSRYAACPMPIDVCLVKVEDFLIFSIAPLGHSLATL